MCLRIGTWLFKIAVMEQWTVLQFGVEILLLVLLSVGGGYSEN